MTATQARWPEAPADIRTLTHSDAFDATCEVVIAQAVSDFRKTLGRTDGTRSAQVVRWTAEFAAVGGEQ